MKYNKVRGIMRAKYGSRIPKFQNPSGGLWQIPSSQQQLYNQAFNWSLPNPNPFMNGSNSPINTQQLFTNTASTNYSNFLKNSKLSFLNKLGDKAGQFLETPTGQSVVGTGLDYLRGTFNNVENSSGIDNAFAAVDTVGNIVGTVNPMAGLAVKAGSTLLKGINSIGGKRADQFSINQNTIENVGGSYGGSVDDINNAAQKAGKKYGLFSGGKRHKANSQIREARRQQNIMTDIANEASDQKAMITDLNYIRHAFDINGGYDLSNIRVAKSGMKIQDKINLVKSKKFNNSYININTKTIEEFKQGGSIQPEWEPIIEDIWEPTIEEFKEGGTLQPEWEPVIELQEGGKIKEESPEIEETNQKNVIPEGALHKNKHHMEHTEGLTQKGIPVVDNEGNQQAEIELNEWTMTLELTKTIEELYKQFYSEEVSQKEKDGLAISAGKILVEQMLHNTDDRTGLIDKIEI